MKSVFYLEVYCRKHQFNYPKELQTEMLQIQSNYLRERDNFSYLYHTKGDYSNKGKTSLLKALNKPKEVIILDEIVINKKDNGFNLVKKKQFRDLIDEEDSSGLDYLNGDSDFTPSETGKSLKIPEQPLKIIKTNIQDPKKNHKIPINMKNPDKIKRKRAKLDNLPFKPHKKLKSTNIQAKRAMSPKEKLPINPLQNNTNMNGIFSFTESKIALKSSSKFIIAKKIAKNDQIHKKPLNLDKNIIIFSQNQDLNQNKAIEVIDNDSPCHFDSPPEINFLKNSMDDSNNDELNIKSPKLRVNDLKSSLIEETSIKIPNIEETSIRIPHIEETYIKNPIIEEILSKSPNIKKTKNIQKANIEEFPLKSPDIKENPYKGLDIKEIPYKSLNIPPNKEVNNDDSLDIKTISKEKTPSKPPFENEEITCILTEKPLPSRKTKEKVSYLKKLLPQPKSSRNNKENYILLTTNQWGNVFSNVYKLEFDSSKELISKLAEEFIEMKLKL